MEDKVKAKIQELCPDVMELKFGCEIQLQNFSEILPMVMVSGAFAIRSNDVSREIVDIRNLNVKEILGSPITLAVVLRAIEQSDKKGVGYDVASTGQFMERRFDVFPKPTGVKWNLTKDNYDDQDEPMKVFIGQLLGVN